MRIASSIIIAFSIRGASVIESFKAVPKHGQRINEVYLKVF